MSLEDWLRNEWLIEHKTSRAEISDLFCVIDRDLVDCRVAELSPDWKLNITYNAALQSAKAALAVAGYRASRAAHHYRVIQSLAYTIHADMKTIALLEQFRKKRNLSDYEHAGAVSEQEVKEILALAETLRNSVKEWIQINYPEFMPV